MFPSTFITKDLDKKKQHSLGLSYNKRIKRPSYFELNPYKYFIDNYSVQTGNPFLNPQFTHSIELGYTLKKQYYFGISYAQTKDVINQVLTLSLVYNFSAGKKFSTKQRGSSNAEEKSRLN